MAHGLILAFAIGFVAGLRSMTALAVVAWGAHLEWLNLDGTPLSLMASSGAVNLLTVLALAEFVADVMPKTPPRTGPVGLITRIITGGLSGAGLSLGNGGGIGAGIIFGIIGAVSGAYIGYYARRGLVNGLKVKDFLIAIPEDIVAIALGCLIVR
jgi:uncharacterized membrane protein